MSRQSVSDTVLTFGHGVFGSGEFPPTSNIDFIQYIIHIFTIIEFKKENVEEWAAGYRKYLGVKMNNTFQPV